MAVSQKLEPQVKQEGLATSNHFTPEVDPLLARYALTGTVKAVETLTPEQKQVFDKVYRDALTSKERGDHSCFSEFIKNGVELGAFTKAFSLDTPLVKLLVNESRKAVFG